MLFLDTLLTLAGLLLLIPVGYLGLLTILSARHKAPAYAPSKLRFDVSFIPQVHDAPVTGRAFVMLTRWPTAS